MTITLQTIIFALLSVVVLGSALFVVTTRNLFHAALMLILSFFGVAGLYVLLESGFFAVAQVLVYIGAISILFIFAVMLTRGMVAMPRVNAQAQLAALVSVLLFVVIVVIVNPTALSIKVLPGASERVLGGIPWQFTTVTTITDSYIKQFGASLVDGSAYLLPFLLAAVLLDIALAGAVQVARERRPAEVLAERELMAAEAAEEQQREQALDTAPETVLAADHH
ncbi:MAG: NADH-quinone oxidoreductase subunit J [Chloroflexi bacterium]|nr:NADH-quinone oxidoreductase subunit J [Chloroflexota bacterium]